MRCPAPPWIAALFFATQVAAAPPPSPSGGARTLVIEVTPAVVVLVPGGHESAEIRVHARDAAGQPVACDLRLGASVGSMGPTSSPRPGEYTATWHAADERFPQVAILFAREPGGAFATRALPLHARVTIEGMAERHSQMSIAIDDRTFGPVAVGRSGSFAVEVEVPPGGRAEGITIDRFGNQRRRAIDLGLPPFPRRLMAVAPDRLVANGAAQAEVLVAAIDGRGRPERGTDACRGMAADTGSISSPVERGPGACSARVTAPVKVGRGAITVRAAGATARVALLPGTPRLVFDDAGGAGRGPRPLVEGGQRQLRLQARDEHGNPVAGLRLEATIAERDPGAPAVPPAPGTVPPVPRVIDLGGGSYALDVRAPRDRDHLRIEVRAPDRPEVATARLDLPLSTPAPVELRLVVEPQRPRPGTAVTVRVLAGRGSPPSGAVWLDASGHVEPWRGSAAPQERACSGAGPCLPARRCWIASLPPPHAGAAPSTGDVELFQCRVTLDPERPRGELLVAATDGGSGATVYRRIPVE